MSMELKQSYARQNVIDAHGVGDNFSPEQYQQGLGIRVDAGPSLQK